MKILLRHLKEADIPLYKYWKSPIHKYHDFNGPYFGKPTEKEIEKNIIRIKENLKNGKVNPLGNRMIISNSDEELIGEVNWYWKSKETLWLEIGIVIFDDKNWGKGIGLKALKLWINEIFIQQKEIIRIGLSTWSGNLGMIHLSEKLGMKKEAEYRKARIINGNYFDSISYGILREEWEEINK